MAKRILVVGLAVALNMASGTGLAQEEESPRDAKPTGAVTYVRGPNGNVVPLSG